MFLASLFWAFFFEGVPFRHFSPLGYRKTVLEVFFSRLGEFSAIFGVPTWPPLRPKNGQKGQLFRFGSWGGFREASGSHLGAIIGSVLVAPGASPARFFEHVSSKQASKNKLTGEPAQASKQASKQKQARSAPPRIRRRGPHENSRSAPSSNRRGGGA